MARRKAGSWMTRSHPDHEEIMPTCRCGSRDCGGDCDYSNGRSSPVTAAKGTRAKLVDILARTGGQLIYQEQVYQILMDIGGFKPGQVEVVRKFIAKKRDVDAMEKLFIAGGTHPGDGNMNRQELFILW